MSLLSTYTMTFFQNKRLQLKHSNILQSIVKKLTIGSMSDSHKLLNPELKQDYGHLAFVMLGPMDYSPRSYLMLCLAGHTTMKGDWIFEGSPKSKLINGLARRCISELQ